VDLSAIFALAQIQKVWGSDAELAYWQLDEQGELLGNLGIGRTIIPSVAENKSPHTFSTTMILCVMEIVFRQFPAKKIGSGAEERRRWKEVMEMAYAYLYIQYRLDVTKIKKSSQQCVELANDVRNCCLFLRRELSVLQRRK